MKNRIGLLLGSFDPPHLGHLALINIAKKSDLIDRLVIIPAYQNPWKKNSTEYYQRITMLSLATTDVYVSMAEEEYNRFRNSTDPIYSSDLLKFIKDTPQGRSSIYYRPENGDELVLITTRETFNDIPKWHNGQWILDNFKIIIVGPGEDIDYTPIHTEHSSDIREMIVSGKSVEGFLDEKVYNYIKGHKLYEDSRVRFI